MYRVIVVEDEDMIRKGLVYSVPWGEWDCAVVGEARNGQEGLREIEEKHPDILLVDVNMPILDGLAMLEQCHEPGCAAILLTGYSDFQYAQKAIQYGVRAYLLKPLNMEELRQAVEQAKEECKMRGAYISSIRQKQTLKENSPIREYQKTPIDESIVRDMLSYIEENYDQKIVMQDVVDRLHYSETFLNRRFKNTVGVTFNEYLNRYRIRKAMEFMEQGVSNVGDLAMKCGFGDYKYFGAVFRKYMDCSPKEYLRNATETLSYEEQSAGIFSK